MSNSAQPELSTSRTCPSRAFFPSGGGNFILLGPRLEVIVDPLLLCCISSPSANWVILPLPQIHIPNSSTAVTLTQVPRSLSKQITEALPDWSCASALASSRAHVFPQNLSQINILLFSASSCSLPQCKMGRRPHSGYLPAVVVLP